MRKMQVWY